MGMQSKIPTIHTVLQQVKDTVLKGVSIIAGQVSIIAGRVSIIAGHVNIIAGHVSIMEDARDNRDGCNIYLFPVVHTQVAYYHNHCQDQDNGEEVPASVSSSAIHFLL